MSDLVKRLRDIRLVTDPNSPLEPPRLRREAADEIERRNKEIKLLSVLKTFCFCDIDAGGKPCVSRSYCDWRRENED